MSKPSTTTTPTRPSAIPPRSAWSKGPPNLSSTSSSNTSPAPTPRSQSPAPSVHHGSHSRKPSALGGAPVAVGSNVSRGGSTGGKGASAVTFGSIDQPTSPPVTSATPNSKSTPPLPSSSQSSQQAAKVKSFGSIPSTSSPPPPVAAPAAATTATSVNGKPPPSAKPTTLARTKLDMKKFFQGGGAPSPTSTSAPLLSQSSGTTVPFQSQNHHQQQPHVPHPHQNQNQSPMMGPIPIPAHQRGVPPLSQQHPVQGQGGYAPYSPSTANRPLSHSHPPNSTGGNGGNNNGNGNNNSQGSIPRSPSFPRSGLGMNGMGMGMRFPQGQQGQGASGGSTPSQSVPAAGGVTPPTHSHSTSPSVPSTSSQPPPPQGQNGTSSVPQSPRVMAVPPPAPGTPVPGGMMHMPMSSGMPMPGMVMWGGGGYYYTQYPDQYMGQGQVGYPPQVPVQPWLPPHMQHQISHPHNPHPQHPQHPQHQHPHTPPSHPHTPQHLHPIPPQTPSQTSGPGPGPSGSNGNNNATNANISSPRLASHQPHPQSPALSHVHAHAHPGHLHHHQPPQHPPQQHHHPHPSLSSPRSSLPPLTAPGPGPGPTSPNHIPSSAVPIPSPINTSTAPGSAAGSGPATPQGGNPNPNRLSLTAGAAAFVPRRTAIVIKDANGKQIDLSRHKREASQSHTSSPAPPPSGSVTPASATGTSIDSKGVVKKPSVVVRMETEEAKQKRLEKEREEAAAKLKKEEEEQERLRKEEEEKERLMREEEERIKKEEEDRKRKQEEEEERLRKQAEEEEKERLRKEEEERLRIQREKEEEEERKEEERKEEERRRQEEEKEKERLRKEEEEKERLRREEEAQRIQLQQELEEKEREEARRKQEEEAAAAIVAAAKAVNIAETEESAKSQSQLSSTPATPPTPATPSTAVSGSKRRPRPGTLDLSNANRPGLPPPLPSALATARIINNLDVVQYPEGIMSPKVELNQGAKEGKFKYDREFLLQFMEVCKEKPDNLPPLDHIGLDPNDQPGGGPGPPPMHRTHSSRRSISSSPNLGGAGQTQSNRAQIGLGIPGLNQYVKNQGGRMGEFGVGANSSSMRHVTGPGAMGPVPFPSKPGLVRPSSQGGPNGVPNQSSGLGRHRDRGSRSGKNRSEAGRVNSHAPPPYGGQTGIAGGFEPVAPLETSANRWTPQTIAASTMGRRGAQQPQEENSPELLDRKVKGLLNKLTMERFDSISDQIIDWANKSEKETDGRTLMRVIRLVFEKATDEATWSEMYARLCRKMLEKISSNVVDESIKTADGKPFAGGQLFRKYLLNRCQEDFERGWQMKEAATAAAAAKAHDDSQAAAKEENGEEALYSEEYYAAQKAKRQGLGLVKFIGELFKLQMLTERIMHECIKKLLSNVDNPFEEEIESLCKLLSTVGQQLDTTKAKNHMDVYFTRMKELANSSKIASRMQYMLVDVIELRERRWMARNQVAAPTTIAAVHEQAAKEKIAAEKEAYGRGAVPMSRGGSRRGEHTREAFGQVNPDGWTTAGNSAGGPARQPLAKAGDLSRFGQIGRNGPAAPEGWATGRPSTAFKKDIKQREAGGTLSRTSSSTNLNTNKFATLAGGGEATAEPASSRGSQPPSRKPSADFTQSGVPEGSMGRKRLQLLPRTVPKAAGKDETDTGENTPDNRSDSEVEEGEIRDNEMADSIELRMSEDDAERIIKEDVKELFSVRNLDEAEEYFKILPSQYHSLLIEKILDRVMEMKESDAKFVASFFQRVSQNQGCGSEEFEQGFGRSAEALDDISVDVPAAYKLMAILLRGSQLPRDGVERLADKIMVEGDPLVAPRQKLLSEYDKLSQ